MRLIRKLKNNIKFIFQRAKKGYCDQDLFNIDAWFIKIFPQMLGEYAEFTIGCPASEEELIKEVKKMSKNWVEEQRPIVNKHYKENNSTDEFDLDNQFCCWLIIILRMKHCFEMCDEWNDYYESYRETNDYERLNDTLDKYKKEAFYLFEKWFYALWW